MYTLPIIKDILIGASIVSQKNGLTTLRIPKEGGGLDVTEIAGHTERYLTFDLECLEDHSLSLNLNAYEQAGDQTAAFFMRFGVLPKLKAKICLDLRNMDANTLFPESYPGQLKVVCHGQRVERAALSQITLVVPPCFHGVSVSLSDPVLTDEFPGVFPLPDGKLIDELGQARRKLWPGKLESVAELREKLNAALTLPDSFAASGWDRFGGFASAPVGEGTGFFTKARIGERWTLVDPLGNAFFSVGPDCVAARADCRVDGMERYMDWLPPEDDPVYGSMYAHTRWPRGNAPRRRDCTTFSFEQANLYRAFGKDWYPKWQSLMGRQLKQKGLNTLGNWSDPKILGTIGMPYVAMLPEFPDTKTRIFRDFPDVFSEEYAADAKRCAQALKKRANDPLMIGYFLRNEPEWAFVNGLILADEALFNPEPTACKRKLVDWLEKRYGSAEALSDAWQMPLDQFHDLMKPVRNASGMSAAAMRDLKAFSRKMLEAYVGIVSDACREADPNHMNLGMRWAWISDPDLVTGWRHFDVFSINCYAVDPTPALDNVVRLGVDLPILIGEYHFGALDFGQSATGLEGVKTQADRGLAYRYYTERAAAHPHGVGCHWFQCYDQFALGRFDGENYNIGLFDLCSLPNEIMMKDVRACAEGLYRVKFGEAAPSEQKPETIPMIAY